MVVLRKQKEKEEKNISPESRKRRKKKPEPWGRRERLLVFYVLVATITLSAFLAVSARSWKLPGFPKITLPSFKGETIIIEGNKDKETQKAAEVVRKFKDETRKLSGVYSLSVVHLESGFALDEDASFALDEDASFAYGVNEEEIFEPASLNKLPVMVAMYMEAEEGNLDLETKYTLKASDKVSGSGSLSGKPAGTVLTYRDIVRLMGKKSDNTAFNIAKEILGREVIEVAIQKIGMKETVIFGEDQKTTPADIALFFQKLWQGEIVSKKNRDEILGFLTDTIYEAWITEGVPDEVRVAHKFGRELHDPKEVSAKEIEELIKKSGFEIEKETKIIPIEGMHHRSDIGKIKALFTEREGAFEIEVDFDEKKATITFNPLALTIENIINILEDAGFRVGKKEALTGYEAVTKETVQIEKRRKRLLWMGTYAYMMFIIVIFIALFWKGKLLGYPGPPPFSLKQFVFFDFLITTPVVIIVGIPFYVGAWRGLMNKKVTHYFLVVFSTLAAYFWSTYSLFWGNPKQEMFMGALVLFAFVTLGEYMTEILTKRMRNSLF